MIDKQNIEIEMKINDKLIEEKEGWKREVGKTERCGAWWRLRRDGEAIVCSCFLWLSFSGGSRFCEMPQATLR